MVKKIGKNHYVASPAGNNTSSQHSLVSTSGGSYLTRGVNKGYSTDGEESQRAGSERTMSEYMMTNERASVVSSAPRSKKHHHHHHHHKHKQQGGGHSRLQTPSRARSTEGRTSRAPSAHSQFTDHEGSDIYVTSGAYRAPSEYSRGSRYSRHSRAPSHYSYRSAPSVVSTVKTKVDKKRGLVIETMSAPNPFCPNTKGLCCLMLLLNLGIILVTLGFVIVIQFFEPLFVWILGIVFLIFGFLTLIGSLIYCVTVCRDVKTPKQVAEGGHYWTRHWQKNIGSPPEIHYKSEDKYHTDTDHYSISEKQSDRHSRY